MTLWTQDKREVLKWYHAYKERQKCAECGAKGDTVKIEFHHLDPAIKRWNISQMVARGFSVGKIKEEIAKCVPLCSRCHRREHRKEGEC